ncbi:recombinase family protein [Lentzea sp. JNUCC 0626]|uniref:recombinase family protein n=1 Tax=Lentzea sp. JNUCC 0626 TaxID=3367513 RepID=UPI0037491B27
MTTNMQVIGVPMALPDGHPLKTGPSANQWSWRERTAKPESEWVAWLYGRVSNKLEDASVENQNELSRGWCADRTWNLTREYNTTGRRDGSASDFAKVIREWWETLLAHVIAGLEDPSLPMPDVVVLYEVSRGDRRLIQWAETMKLFAAAGILVGVHSEERVFDPRLDSDWESLMNLALKAEAEVKRTRRRSTRNLSQRMAAGVPMGPIPAGWFVKKDSRGKTIVEIDGRPVIKVDGKAVVHIDGRYVPVDEVEGRRVRHFEDPKYAPIRAEVITRVGKGEPFSDIRDDMISRGVLAPSDYQRKQRGEPVLGVMWDDNAVKRMASDPRCIGKLMVDGELIDGQVEPIVGPEVFYRALNVVNDAARKAKYTGKAPEKPGSAVHLLRPACTCQWSKRNRMTRHFDGKYHNYECRVTKGCSRRIHGPGLEAYVVATVVQWLTRPDVLALFPAADDVALSRARADRDKAQVALAEVLAAQEEGGPDAPSWRVVDIEVKRQEKAIADAEKLIKSLAIPTAVRDVLGVGTDVVNLTEWFVSPQVPMGARRTAIDRLVTVVVKPGRRGRVKTAQGEHISDRVRERVDILLNCPRGCGSHLVERDGAWPCPKCDKSEQNREQVPATAA